MGDGSAYNYIAMSEAVKDSGLQENEVSNITTGMVMGSGGPSIKNVILAADKNKELLNEFEDTEQKLKDAEKRIEDVRSTAEGIDYQGIEDLDNELDRLTALNQSVETLNNSLDSKLKTARIATSEVEKRARMVEKELNDDLAAKTNLEKEIDDLRDKHENDMRLSDRMTREIGSLRKMSEEAEDIQFKVK